ncbi:hypothetical protein [Halobacteriovorax sp. BALOs_7]|uniref:hypothetical protein n=1 Tax=Halobacteriovorax sp. BALOs_7 TaxID=2109558 RepID=UPI0013C515EF|nr:hypothetical protein [Halobacteriovorax sp. BALOs_7]
MTLKIVLIKELDNFVDKSFYPEGKYYDYFSDRENVARLALSQSATLLYPLWAPYFIGMSHWRHGPGNKIYKDKREAEKFEVLSYDCFNNKIGSCEYYLKEFFSLKNDSKSVYKKNVNEVIDQYLNLRQTTDKKLSFILNNSLSEKRERVEQPYHCFDMYILKDIRKYQKANNNFEEYDFYINFLHDAYKSKECFLGRFLFVNYVRKFLTRNKVLPNEIKRFSNDFKYIFNNLSNNELNAVVDQTVLKLKRNTKQLKLTAGEVFLKENLCVHKELEGRSINVKKACDYYRKF